MKVFYFSFILSGIVASENIKRSSNFGLGGTFSSFKGPSFFSTSGLSSSSSPSYSAPAPVAPAPSYPKTTHSKPSYGHQPQTHNCSIQEEKASASVCVPTLGAPECSPVTLKGVGVVEKEQCLSITRTVCTQTEEEVTVEVCSITYSPAPVQAEATLVDVSFKKECSKQMVTVCQPQQGYTHSGYNSGYNKGSYQHCKEIAQETCYNKPSTGPKQEQVTLMVPSPNQECRPQSLTLPKVECEDITEERCVNLPAVEATDVESQQCTVPVGEPRCNQVDLTLPLQVCREILYGDAHKPEPVYQPEPEYKPSGYSA